jgi:hypothetical protein
MLPTSRRKSSVRRIRVVLLDHEDARPGAAALPPRGSRVLLKYRLPGYFFNRALLPINGLPDRRAMSWRPSRRPFAEWMALSAPDPLEELWVVDRGRGMATDQTSGGFPCSVRRSISGSVSKRNGRCAGEAIPSLFPCRGKAFGTLSLKGRGTDRFSERASIANVARVVPGARGGVRGASWRAAGETVDMPRWGCNSPCGGSVGRRSRGRPDRGALWHPWGIGTGRHRGDDRGIRAEPAPTPSATPAGLGTPGDEL